MPGGELEPIGRLGPASAEVAAEMSEIFAHAGLDQSIPGIGRTSAVIALPPKRRRGRTATFLTAVAAGLAGLGAGALVVRTLEPAAPAAARMAARPPPQPQAPGTPSFVLAKAAPAPVVEAEPTAPVAKGSAAPTGGAPRTRTPHRMKLARLGGAGPRGRIRTGPAIPMAPPVSCEQDAGGDDCRRDVLEADSHLRAAYDRAIRRGVSHSVLVDYRNRWADLRERDKSDPTSLIDKYTALANDLGREDGDGQAAPHPKGRWLRALADLLRPRR